MAVATRRLWLAADGSVVGEGDPLAATLLVAVGQEMPAGYVDPFDVVESKAEAAPPDKAAPKPANKAQKA